MSVRLVRLWRRLRGPDPSPESAKLEELNTLVRTLGAEVRSMRKGLKALAEDVETLDRQTSRLAHLPLEEQRTTALLDDLSSVLDTDRTAAHVRQAIALAELDDRNSLLSMNGLLPGDLFESVVAAIPSPIFFDGDGVGGMTLAVPPPLASTYSTSVLTFVTRLVKDTIGPALVERLLPQLSERTRVACRSLPADFAVTYTVTGEVMLTRAASAPTGKPWEFVRVVVSLGRFPGEAARERDLLPNHAVASFVGSHGWAPAPSDRTDAMVLLFHIGPDAASRRTMTAHLDEATRRAWESARD